MYRTAVISVGNSQDALDIVQDAMFRFVKKYAKKPRDEWRPLLFRILYNLIRDFGRRKSLTAKLFHVVALKGKDEGTFGPEDFPDEDVRTPAEEFAALRDVKQVDNALSALPLKQREAFLLRAWEEMSVKETAQIMGCSEGSVKTHFHRAVHSLRTTLEEVGTS